MFGRCLTQTHDREISQLIWDGYLICLSRLRQGLLPWLVYNIRFYVAVWKFAIEKFGNNCVPGVLLICQYGYWICWKLIYLIPMELLHWVDSSPPRWFPSMFQWWITYWSTGKISSQIFNLSKFHKLLNDQQTIYRRIDFFGFMSNSSRSLLLSTGRDYIKKWFIFFNAWLH